MGRAKWFKIMRMTAAVLSALLVMATVAVWIDSRSTQTYLVRDSLEPPGTRSFMLNRGRIGIGAEWAGQEDKRGLMIMRSVVLSYGVGWHWKRGSVKPEDGRWTYQIAHISPSRFGVEDWHFLGWQFSKSQSAGVMARALSIPCSWLLILFSILPAFECVRLIARARARRRRGFAVLHCGNDEVRNPKFESMTKSK
jgi:hypothetical protein